MDLLPARAVMMAAFIVPSESWVLSPECRVLSPGREIPADQRAQRRDIARVVLLQLPAQGPGHRSARLLPGVEVQKFFGDGPAHRLRAPRPRQRLGQGGR